MGPGNRPHASYPVGLECRAREVTVGRIDSTRSLAAQSVLKLPTSAREVRVTPADQLPWARVAGVG